MNIQRGITHCDTIGDIFKNPILLKFIRDWYEIKHEGKTLQVRKKIQGKKRYTPEFYEFIREVFEDRTNMENFLAHVRESVLNTKKFLYNFFEE